MIATIHLFDLAFSISLVGLLVALIWWMFMQIQDCKI